MLVINLPLRLQALIKRRRKEYFEKNPDQLHVDDIVAIDDISKLQLTECFMWKDTPEGNEYWNRINDNDIELISNWEPLPLTKKQLTKLPTLPINLLN